MAIKYTSTKTKKEKPAKIKQEKPKKVKQASSLKIQKDNSVKIKKEKPVKVEKAPKTAKSNAPKIQQAKGGVKITGSKKTNKTNTKKRTAPLVIILLVVLVAALLVAAIIMKKNYDNQIARILVSNTPDKLEYYVGDSPKYKGLKVQVVLNSGDSYYVDESDCRFSGFDSSISAERQTITVSYGGYTCTYKITIKDLPTPARVLSNIYLETLPKTEYKVGEWLNTTGGVLVVE